MEPDGNQPQLQTNDAEALSFCPSFNSYSSDRLAQIAADVTDNKSHTSSSDDFEFAFVRGGNLETTPDEISHDGYEFRQIFPVFNRDIVLFGDDRDRGDDDAKTILLPLKELFDVEERDPPSSSSSSEVDELDRIPEGTYCVWRPKKTEESASPSWCKKSNSTGSASKRWKLRDLLLHRRSNSDGKDSFVFLTPKNNRDTKEVESSKGKAKAKGGGGEKSSPTSAHEVFYVRNRASKEVDKRKSYLPYRKDLVGFFASINGVGARKTFPPF
ncbi:hypothetical protein Vadar_004103 [Vaccinium darrowii]|uniref:Uncharacterized protein n=1 Tax=Vaccinium darrowii TaxID=229202 RepID=A0ACB7XWI1_9ERIC|nr:hypothetical protein Vadar_004103 [Vaccinium darrowii]